MTEVKTGDASKKPLFSTQRTDNWRLGWLSVAIGFALFIVYVNFRIFFDHGPDNTQYAEIGNLLSPFFSPKIPFPHWLNWLPQILKTPAILILWIPALFRATCYYYRKAYYRSFFSTPPACGVSGYKGMKYEGETKFPFVFQNLHRYMFYLATIVLVILWWDALQTLFAKDHFFNFGYFQFSLGSVVFFANVILLSAYSFGCHAFRHLIGGRLDCFSCGEQAKTCLSFWDKVTHLNEHHQFWAWLSLCSVAFADLYTRCVASGCFADPVIFSMIK